MKNKAVVLGSNYYIGLSVIRCLGSQGIHTVAVDYSTDGTYGARSKYCSEQLIAPHYKKETEAFVQFLKDYAKAQDEPPVLFPCHDAYVEVIDTHLETLKEDFLIAQTEPGIQMRLMDKMQLYPLAASLGVRVPETLSPDEPNLMERVAAEIKYPCAVKPADSPAFMSVFHKKLFIADSPEALTDALKRSKEAGFEMMVQRIIPGFDDHMHTFDAYMDQQGEITHWATFQKYRQYPINFGASVYTGQKYFPELYDIGAPFFKKLGYRGFAEIEFKKDAENGAFYLIEVNVRTTNFNTLLNKIGLNMPYIAYCDLLGKPLPPKAVKEDLNIVFQYGFEDLLAIRDYIKVGQLTASQVFRSLFVKKAPSIWDWNDPAPGFMFMGMLLDKVFAKFKRR